MGSCASCATNFSTQRCEGSRRRWIWWSQTIRIGSVQIEEDRARYPYQLNVFACILSLKTAKISGELILDEVIPFCRLGFPALKCIGKGIAGLFHRSTHAQAKLTQVKKFWTRERRPTNAHEPLTRIMKHESWWLCPAHRKMSSRDAVYFERKRWSNLQQVHSKTSKIDPPSADAFLYVNRLAQEVDSVAISVGANSLRCLCLPLFWNPSRNKENINFSHQVNFLNISPHKDVIDGMRLT